MGGNMVVACNTRFEFEELLVTAADAVHFKDEVCLHANLRVAIIA